MKTLRIETEEMAIDAYFVWAETHNTSCGRKNGSTRNL